MIHFLHLDRSEYPIEYIDNGFGTNYTSTTHWKAVQENDRVQRSENCCNANARSKTGHCTLVDHSTIGYCRCYYIAIANLFTVQGMFGVNSLCQQQTDVQSATTIIHNFSFFCLSFSVASSSVIDRSILKSGNL